MRLSYHRIMHSTSHRMTAHRMTAHRMTAHRMTAHRMTAHRLTAHSMTADSMTAHRMTSHSIAGLETVNHGYVGDLHHRSAGTSENEVSMVDNEILFYILVGSVSSLGIQWRMPP